MPDDPAYKRAKNGRDSIPGCTLLNYVVSSPISTGSAVHSTCNHASGAIEKPTDSHSLNKASGDAPAPACQCRVAMMISGFLALTSSGEAFQVVIPLAAAAAWS